MSRISIRYAKALFSLAQDENKLNKIANDLIVLKDLLVESKDFEAFISNPLISGHKKAEIMKELFSGKIDTLTLNFLFLLCDKKRVSVLNSILERFDALLLDFRNQIVAEIASPSVLDQKQLDAIKANLETMTNKSVLLETKEDPALIGGFTVKIEDVIIDNSIRYQLAKLKEKLVS